MVIKMDCPLCNVPLSKQQGDTLNPGNSEFGVTLYCGNRDCYAQEVMGHGSNDSQAFSIIREKFHKDVDNQIGL